MAGPPACACLFNCIRLFPQRQRSSHTLTEHATGVMSPSCPVPSRVPVRLSKSCCGLKRSAKIVALGLIGYCMHVRRATCARMSCPSRSKPKQPAAHRFSRNRGCVQAICMNWTETVGACRRVRYTASNH
eukprot:2471945-Pleurochrysis_carterae.AAC.1